MIDIRKSLRNLFFNMSLKPDAQTELQGDLAVRGSLSALALATPGTPTITNIGTTGAVTYGYKVTATVAGLVTAVGAEGTTTTGHATLDATNYNVVTWAVVPGATGYKIYRTTGGTTPPMLIATITSRFTLTYNDQDKTSGSSETPSTVNGTGAIITRSKAITATRDMTAASGNVSYTGVGFKPTAVFCFAVVGKPTSWGFSDSALTSEGILQSDTADTYSATAHLARLYTSAGVEQKATVASLDADGFTLTWTKVGLPTGTADLSFLCLE